MKPRAGQRGTYIAPNGGVVGFTVNKVEDSLCWATYDNRPNISLPFIWTFHDGLNTLHDWPGKATNQPEN